MKGQSGNPAGRPPRERVLVREVRELARKYALDALEELRRLATSADDEKVRLAACEAILDRGLGTPHESQPEASETEVPMRQLTPEELRAAEQAMLPERADEQAS